MLSNYLIIIPFSIILCLYKDTNFFLSNTSCGVCGDRRESTVIQLQGSFLKLNEENQVACGQFITSNDLRPKLKLIDVLKIY